MGKLKKQYQKKIKKLYRLREKKDHVRILRLQKKLNKIIEEASNFLNEKDYRKIIEKLLED